MKRFIEWLIEVIKEFLERRRKMDYFITLNGKSIDAIGEAVEKPITVIEGLKEDIAELEQTVEQKDERIAELLEEIAELEANSPLVVDFYVKSRGGVITSCGGLNSSGFAIETTKLTTSYSVHRGILTPTTYEGVKRIGFILTAYTSGNAPYPALDTDYDLPSWLTVAATDSTRILFAVDMEHYDPTDNKVYITVA